MSERGEGKVVCVTGASGYVASWLVKRLLHRGYTVKATVRNLNDPRKVEHLKALEGANERLQLFEADLIEDGCFDSVIDGCDGVFHTASPVLFQTTNPQKWYPLSKTLAEAAAWKFAEENGVDLVSMHPGFVLGPLLQPTLNYTSGDILDIIKGKEVFPFFDSYRFVDVRDVVYAHIMAFENSSASGRYCLVGKALPKSEARQILHKLYPSISEPVNATVTGDSTFQVSKKKAESLGVDFMPLEVSLRDTVESLKDKKFLN